MSWLTCCHVMSVMLIVDVDRTTVWYFSTGPDQRSVPKQWLVAKTIPVFKNKGNVKDIENYRPIANLCSTSKIFEKLILKRIQDIEEEKQVDLTGINQHGFKKNRSTSTLSANLQSIIARALDNDKFALVASLDLSSAFDVVDIKLLIKRLKIFGLPSDVIELIEVWLNDRMYYVSLDGQNSILYDLLLGTVQGSILGPFLYAIFVSPIFDNEFMLAFADDIFVPITSNSTTGLIDDMEKTLESITKWLKKSGLVVNDAKTDLCLFYKKETQQVSINLGMNVITSKNVINVLGVTFDSRLQWSEQVSKTISKANRALFAIKLIRRFLY